ncbi:hydroxyacid dehydrogenase [Paenibacillus sp. UNC451MF]|uniref:hydroxyacid dehydrogenase n=1 Tax=Paenibacillus sp. UNC451MF TaxID=1449063 RepID=UPI00048C8219|nr:hydroxyacid dehydrogenase [Paenibacillus sp. UNC451MF]
MKKRAMFLGSEIRIKDVYNDSIQQELSTLADLYPIVVNKDNVEEHAASLRTIEVAFSSWGMPTFNREEIQKYFPNLKALFYAAGSVQNFARPFLHQDITIVSAWAANAVPVAEYTAAQIVLANKGFFQSALRCKTHRRDASRYAKSFPGNFNARVGILGAGMIGRKVIELLKPYQLEIDVFDPFLSDAAAQKLNVHKKELKEIFTHCHTISNHLANLPATVGILNKEHFELMLPYATFINTARGLQVVEEDLIRALRTVPTRTAVLDVTYPEPAQPESELLTLDNVILTPHIAGSNPSEVTRMAEYVLDEFRRYLQQEELHYQVSLKMLETMA